MCLLMKITYDKFSEFVKEKKVHIVNGSTCWESLVMSTGLILLKADNLSSLSLACCSTAMTKASCTWLFSASSLAISNWTNNVTFGSDVSQTMMDRCRGLVSRGVGHLDIAVPVSGHF